MMRYTRVLLPANQNNPVDSFEKPDAKPKATDVFVRNLASYIDIDTEENNREVPNIDEIPQDADPNKQGVIRTVPGAHLIYKRKGPDDSYQELWIYNTGRFGEGMMRAQRIRKSILAGTDIPADKMSSPNGEQRAETWACGNAEMLLISGLVN